MLKLEKTSHLHLLIHKLTLSPYKIVNFMATSSCASEMAIRCHYPLITEGVRLYKTENLLIAAAFSKCCR